MLPLQEAALAVLFKGQGEAAWISYFVSLPQKGCKCDLGGMGGIFRVKKKSESTNSDTTKPVLFLQNEGTKYAGLAKVAHEKQWMIAVISQRTFLVHQSALLSAPH